MKIEKQQTKEEVFMNLNYNTIDGLYHYGNISSCETETRCLLNAYHTVSWCHNTLSKLRKVSQKEKREHIKEEIAILQALQIKLQE